MLLSGLSPKELHGIVEKLSKEWGFVKPDTTLDQMILKYISNSMSDVKDMVETKKINQEMLKKGFYSLECSNALDRLEKEGLIYCPRFNYYKLTKWLG